jgi:ribosomal protein L40E
MQNRLSIDRDGDYQTTRSPNHQIDRMPPVNERPVRPPRSDTREVLELKQIKAEHPELAAAVDMQIELVDVQRRVQSRVPLPWMQFEPQWLAAQRQTADILRRHDALEAHDHAGILALSRDGNALEPLVRAWYAVTSRVDPHTDERWPAPATPQGLDQVFLLALRPFLSRCAEALMPRPEFSTWHHAHCPVCGWEAEFAAITPAAERRLLCGRCSAQWGFDATNCPYCDNTDRTRITSFATRDGVYRVYACDQCKRYLKAFDGRKMTRTVMAAVDTIATLPLDAAAMQRGYTA